VENYLEGLNPAQHQAVVNTQGPALVIAGAGSGKTRVLTVRIAHLLKNGARPSEILSLTFTNKAAREMKERIAKIVGEQTARYLWMGTFHSIFARILRTEAEAIKFPSSFTIYDTADAKNLLKTIIKELNLDPKVYKLNNVLGRISSAKNDLITPDIYRSTPQFANRDRNARQPEIGRIYQIYVQRCKQNNAMDFDDLLLYTNVLFRDHKDILKKYQERFRFLLVDEYQDTNFSQYLIIKKLAAEHHNLCVVGDDAQSIYSFRGAKIENILNFKTDYPEYKLFKLEQNYRSTQNIVNAANSVIAKNSRQIEKDVFSEKIEGNPIDVIETFTDSEEGAVIAGKIMDMRMAEQYAYKDFAILYRTNAQSRVFEEAFRKRNIPYKIFGGLSFYQRKEIKDILAYCRLVINSNDNEALKRIINYPKRGIGGSSVAKMEGLANNDNQSIWQIVSKFEQYADLNKPRLAKPLVAFRAQIDGFKNAISEMNAYEALQVISKQTGLLKELYVDKTPEGVSRYENLQELINGVQEFVQNFDIPDSQPTLDVYLQNVALLTDQDSEDSDNDHVMLMTIHSSKGLEFKNVFLVGVEEELFPSQRSTQSLQELEEERRLFYVAVTRAEENLCISFAKSRFRWGQTSTSKPSRFIREIDSHFLNFQRGASFNPKSTSANKRAFVSSKPKLTALKNTQKNTTTASNTSTFKASSLNGLKIGNHVEHQKFGKGIVEELKTNGNSNIAIVNFENVGKKQLLLKFAKLKIIK